MTQTLSRPPTTTTLDTPDVRTTCPMCHSAAPATQAGGAWLCGRCGQHWDAGRLATVSAYQAWAVAHEHARQPAPAPEGTVSSPPAPGRQVGMP